MSQQRTVLDALLADIPAGCQVTEVFVGANWVLARVNHADGTRRAGVAAAPLDIDSRSPFQIGHYRPNADATTVVSLLRWNDPTSAAVGLATINALLNPASLSAFDAADWLAERCATRRAAIIGRFPFIDAEVRPAARQVWVFEREPQFGEYGTEDMANLLPQAEVVAITSSTIINHTIDQILPLISPDAVVALIGPSTPLTTTLFACGIHALFGVRVADVEQAAESVLTGDGFQKMRGLQRVSLIA